MPRAFLSHSSIDKPYVGVVARRLGRGRVLFDVQNFEPGQDFRDAIRQGLDQSALFVLFASAESLKSTWVQFEINEAESRRLAGKLRSVLVFIIDPKIGVRDLPEWMQRGRVIVQPKPTQAARIILSQLIYQTGEEQQSLFVGREGLMQEIAKGLVPSSGQRVPQVVIASGLEGVGRRTVIRRAFRDNLSLDFGPMITLEETDGLDRLYVQLLDETMEINSRKDLALAVKEFAAADAGSRATLISTEIEKIARDNVATVVIDEGTAFVDADGVLRPETVKLFERLGENKVEPYLLIVQRRRPQLSSGSFGHCKVASFQVGPLSLDSTRRLLIQSLKNAHIDEPSPDEADELAPYLGGYPPAVSLAVGFAKTYGLPILLADKSILVDFKVRTFARVIQRLGLSPSEQTVARVLGYETYLSVDVIATMTSIGSEEVAKILRGLIDQSMVIHTDGRYSLASPLRDTIFRAYGFISPEEFARMAQTLRAKYWADPNQIPSLDAIDATIYSLARGGHSELSEFADITLPSTLMKVANEAYNERQWQVAKDFAERAMSADGSSDRAITIFSKSLVRLAHEGREDWSKAEQAVRNAEGRRVRGNQYLRGFLEWKRGNFEAAVRAYQLAERLGDHSVGVYRDRAYCLFRMGRLKEAEDAIRVALDRYPRNNYVVDLAAEIAIRRGNFKQAEELMKDLKDTDVMENYYHRSATLKAARKEFQAALVDAELAIERKPPLHEILAQHVDILIELGRFDDAKARLEELSQKFKGRNTKDAQLGLQCKLSLRQSDWREAEAHYMHLNAKDLPVHLGLRREILRQKSQDPRISAEDRDQAMEEMNNLEAKLARLN